MALATGEENVETKIDSVEYELPQSLVAKDDKDHSKRNAYISKCFNISYDILTILISIADITTDVMVLISYYINNRMTFFWMYFH